MGNWVSLARLAAQRYGIPEDIFIRQIRQESGGNPKARSPAGALGIAQFMPATARGMGVDPMNPRSALMGAARMDAQNLKKYGNWKDVLSLYNSGRGWSQGQGISETRNYVNSILSGASPGGASGSPQIAPNASNPVGGGNSLDFRRALAQKLLDASAKGGQMDSSTLVGMALARQSQSPLTSDAPTNASGSGGGKGHGGLAELFYDPLGGMKNGKEIGAIGGHSDHVHISETKPNVMLRAIHQAQAMGLHVGENPYVGKVNPVHVGGSYHYRDFSGTYGGRRLGQAADISGTATQMAAFYRWAQRTLR